MRTSPKDTKPEHDPDYDWLLGHLLLGNRLPQRNHLSEKVVRKLQEHIETGKLPYTLGVFGGWGGGKTTFLALIAEQLEKTSKGQNSARVIYFNAWKYAGFMEIVPSLIYKILKFGVADTKDNRDAAALKVLLSLGKKYSDVLGDFSKKWTGVDLPKVFEQVYGVAKVASGLGQVVPAETLVEYYNQVDRAQDALVEVLGQTEDGKPAENPIIVLIDELDRCDPDEAYEVIKQLRVLFAMRRLPIAFVVCANPDPIGLAIKHRFGLESTSGDYESRRMLEKFVDSYEDLSKSIQLGSLIQHQWNSIHVDHWPWILRFDHLNKDPDLVYANDVLKNATGFDVMLSGISFYSNLRLLFKTLDTLSWSGKPPIYIAWTIWHIQLATQIDPNVRRKISIISHLIQSTVRATYAGLSSVSYTVTSTSNGTGLKFNTNDGRTLFAIYRSIFWGHAKNWHSGADLNDEQRGAAKTFLGDSHLMDFIILMTLIPLEKAPSHEFLSAAAEGTKSNIPNLDSNFSKFSNRLGYILSEG